MNRILFPKLWCTPLEIERYKQCQKDFGTKGYLYYITELSPVGYSIVFSTKRLKNVMDSLDETTSRNITDMDHMLDVF